MTETPLSTSPLLCVSCGLETLEWPDGNCPRCRTRHQPLVLPPVPLPVYRGTVIYVCPGCDGDLQHEGDGYWCPACRQSWSFTQVGVYEDEDDRDD